MSLKSLRILRLTLFIIMLSFLISLLFYSVLNIETLFGCINIFFVVAVTLYIIIKYHFIRKINLKKRVRFLFFTIDASFLAGQSRTWVLLYLFLSIIIALTKRDFLAVVYMSTFLLFIFSDYIIRKKILIKKEEVTYEK